MKQFTQKVTDRIAAFEWWNNLTAPEKWEVIDKTSDPIRLPESLTGKEIEQLWRERTQTPNPPENA